MLAGYGVTFISRAAVEAELASGALAEARIEGMDGRREISLARGAARAQTRVADAFVELRARAGGRGRSAGSAVSRRPTRTRRRERGRRPARIMRFGAGSLAELADVCGEAGIDTAAPRHDPPRRRRGGGRCRSSARFDGVRPHAPVETVREAARARSLRWMPTGSSASAAAARSTPARRSSRRSRPRTPSRCPASSRSRRPTPAPSGRRPSGCCSRPGRKGGGRRRARPAGRGDLRPGADPRAARSRRPSGRR